MQIVVSNLGYSSGEINHRLILEDISFSIGNQDIFGIIGASGAGKTTLGQLLAGLIKPTSGEIRFDTPSHLQVGMVFQNPEEQFFEETLIRDARVGLQDRGWDKKTIEENIERAFSWVGLGGYLHRSPFSLSGGERRLAAIGCVLSADPDIIIFDEPTAGLDPPHRRRIYKLAHTLKKQGKTVCIISHDLEWLAPLVNRLILLKEGKVLWSGDTAELFSHPELIAEAGLELPEIPLIMEELKKSGFPVDTTALRIRDAARIISKSFFTTKNTKSTKKAER